MPFDNIELDPRDARVQLNVPVPFHLRQDLTNIARQQGISQAALIRDCIELQLANQLAPIRTQRLADDEKLKALVRGAATA